MAFDSKLQFPASEFDDRILEDSSSKKTSSLYNLKCSFAARSHINMRISHFLFASMLVNLSAVGMLFKDHFWYTETLLPAPAVLLLVSIGCGVVWTILEYSLRKGCTCTAEVWLRHI